jgi:hypothetical protein
VQALQCRGLFESTLAQLSARPHEALWLQASAYPLYETRARCAQLLAEAVAAPQRGADGRAEAAKHAEEYLDALSLCLRLLGVAAAGSDMHVQLAVRYCAAAAAQASRCPGSAAESQRADEAQQRLQRALCARYGAGCAGATGPPAAPLDSLLRALQELEATKRDHNAA